MRSLRKWLEGLLTLDANSKTGSQLIADAALEPTIWKDRTDDWIAWRAECREEAKALTEAAKDAPFRMVSRPSGCVWIEKASVHNPAISYMRSWLSSTTPPPTFHPVLLWNRVSDSPYFTSVSEAEAWLRDVVAVTTEAGRYRADGTKVEDKP